MKAEIITIGTDVLLGQTTNSNAAYIARELTTLGIGIGHHVTVGEFPEQIIETIKQAEKRSNLIIFTGGMGPTEETNTKKVLAHYLKRDLILHEETENKIITYHKNSQFDMPEKNQLQALILSDSTPLLNETGLAVGVLLEEKEHTYVLLPGPPDELEPMVENQLKGEFISRFGDKKEVVTRTLNFFGISKKDFEEKLSVTVKKQTNLNPVIYTNLDSLTVELTVQTETKQKAESLLDTTEDSLLKQTSDYFYSYGDHPLSEVVKDLLLEKELTISAAESLTGGAFLSALTSGFSAGEILNGGLVTYSTEMKNKVLGVTKKTIENYGVISPECAIEMAEKVQKIFGADVGIGLTGVAGPSSMEEQIPGTVWIGLSYKNKPSFAKHFHFGYKRNRNRRLAVLHALDMVRRLLQDLPIDQTVKYGEKPEGE